MFGSLSQSTYLPLLWILDGMSKERQVMMSSSVVLFGSLSLLGIMLAVRHYITGYFWERFLEGRWVPMDQCHSADMRTLKVELTVRMLLTLDVGKSWHIHELCEEIDFYMESTSTKWAFGIIRAANPTRWEKINLRTEKNMRLEDIGDDSWLCIKGARVMWDVPLLVQTICKCIRTRLTSSQKIPQTKAHVERGHAIHISKQDVQIWTHSNGIGSIGSKVGSPALPWLGCGGNCCENNPPTHAGPAVDLDFLLGASGSSQCRLVCLPMSTGLLVPIIICMRVKVEFSRRPSDNRCNSRSLFKAILWV